MRTGVRLTCEDCVRAHILTTYDDFNIARKAARDAKLSDIFWECPDHGLWLHNVRTGECRTCSSTPRTLARRAGKDAYVDDCATHGPANFSTAHGKCLRCFTTAGLLRKRGPPSVDKTSLRVLARRLGHRTFQGACVLGHGRTAHSVETGKCLTCFNSKGALRIPLT